VEFDRVKALVCEIRPTPPFGHPYYEQLCPDPTPLPDSFDRPWLDRPDLIAHLARLASDRAELRSQEQPSALI